MIIPPRRNVVIENIRSAVEKGEFQSIVEPDDPILTPQQSKEFVENYLLKRKSISFRLKSFAVRKFANLSNLYFKTKTDIVGFEKLPEISGGAIITSNHFNPTDHAPIRILTKKLGRKRINVLSKDTNFFIPGAIGILLKYADTIPVSPDINYMKHGLPSVISELFKNNEFLLVYPEQEMWFHYRKPRPLKRGAYQFAAEMDVPIISCFTELIETPKKHRSGFNKIRYRLHVLGVLCPDKSLSVRENSLKLCAADYELKKNAYEKIYQKKLLYDFSVSDIAGAPQT